MRYIAVWDEGDSTDITPEVLNILDKSGADLDEAFGHLFVRVRGLMLDEAEHKATRDYGERHEGAFRMSGGGDALPDSQ